MHCPKVQASRIATSGNCELCRYMLCYQMEFLFDVYLMMLPKTYNFEMQKLTRLILLLSLNILPFTDGVTLHYIL